VYFSVNGVRYWALLTPSGVALYRKEGSKTKYLGRLSATEIKEMLAKASTETLRRIKSDVESALQVLNRQKTAASASQLSQPSSQQPSLTWKKDSNVYWLIYYNKTFYIYVKGSVTRHKPRLIEKTDVSGVIGRLVAAGALHVLEALRALVNGMYTAVADLLRSRSAAEASHREAQASRKEAEEAFRRLTSELRRAVKRWDEKWRREAGEYEGPPDRKWLRERLSDFIDENMYLLEKILHYEDLLDKFVDAAAEAAAGYLSRSDVLKILK
jgi:ribosomal protein L22